MRLYIYTRSNYTVKFEVVNSLRPVEVSNADRTDWLLGGLTQIEKAHY